MCIQVRVVVGSQSVDPLLAAHNLATAVNDFLGPIEQESVRRVETYFLAYDEDYQFFAFIWLHTEDEDEDDPKEEEVFDDTPQPTTFKGGNPYA